MIRTLTLVDGPALKSAPICERVAHLSRLMILVSRRWSRSCIIFSGRSDCHRFDVLPDSRYSRYTREMVERENPNFIATSEMLCLVSCVPTITPLSNSNLDNPPL
ncbi:hypothetical protein AVEN_25632-1 [Araneus ventricosus]|uniref:Uncharacterized protein n=1 Tax=Araneus ventricosus TaxID=182803 RepID=A0A4Y2BPK1_ARAVE|nr:hypothetical protein AVEN_25632-1 [Araneus ventricosus]